jgi:aspartyl-tRNA(Asn)/glutamyl-tRNA(Gln) amidotransferase subunit A
LTRSVEDAAHLLAALEGRAVAELKNASIEGARLLVLQTVALDDLSEAPRAAFVNAVQRLQAAGAVVDHAEIPVVAEAMALSAILFTSEAYGTWKTEIEAQPELMFKEVRERFQSGKDHLAADYVAAWQRLDQLRAQYLETTAGYDAVIVPTAPNLPPNLQRLATDKDYFVAENLMTLRNTRIGNLMGLAGLTLPTGVPSCGIMFLSNPMSEERLLRLGKAAEDALA